MAAMPGAAICHIEIPSIDLAAMKTFYETVFGWTVSENVPGPGYWFFESGGVGGGFDSGTKPGDGVVLYLQVSDIDDALALIQRHGGAVTRGKEPIGDADPGFDARFTDPSGNRLGLYSAG